LQEASKMKNRFSLL